MFSKRKITAALLAVTLLFSGCSAGVITGAPPSRAESSGTAVQVQTTVTKSNNERDTVSKTQIPSVDESEPSAESTSRTADQSTTRSRNETTGTTTEKTTEKQQTTTKETTSATTTEAALYCTVTVECTDIYNHLDYLKEGHEAYLPKDGYFLKDYRYRFKDGDTVYSVLLACAKENELRISSRNTEFGKYVSGINNIDEFDVGKELGWTSGWIYYVNGNFANYASSKYKVKNGDKIVFSYSCNDL